jgi:hypothetical protein
MLPACLPARKRLYFRSIHPTYTAIHKVYLELPRITISSCMRDFRGEFSANDTLDFTRNARGKTVKRVNSERERSWKEQAAWYTQTSRENKSRRSVAQKMENPVEPLRRLAREARCYQHWLFYCIVFARFPW